MHAVTPRVADKLGGCLLAQDAHDCSGDRADLVARQCIALHLARALDVDARPLRCGTHRLRPRRIACELWRVVVAHHVDAVHLDDLGRGRDVGGDGKNQCAQCRAQCLFQHDIPSRLYCSKRRLERGEGGMRRRLIFRTKRIFLLAVELLYN